ncbi:MAG TPA: YciI family protein [Burkholderiales bacterium]
MTASSKAVVLTLLIAAAVVAAPGATAQEAPALFIVHFETGPAWDKSLDPSVQRGFAEHSANMNRLRKEGAISFGARYGDYGLIILKSASMDAAKAILDADPGVQAGIFIYRVAPLSVFYPWQE